MIEANIDNQKEREEQARIAVDAVFEELGLSFPEIEGDIIICPPKLPKVILPKTEIITETGIKDMMAAKDPLEFARSMVDEAHRTMPGIAVVKIEESTNEQFLLAA